ncbi:MAG: Fe-S cluster scaffold complex subunit SufD [Candidatus Westeberhardia cardiocondylae]|nr:Fe-S cluster scaffold complex subunit SufD [Candidatus Westeberhardia cardiocondylae]
MKNLSKNTIKTLNDWNKIFKKKQKIFPSIQANLNWKNVEILGIPTKRNKNWQYTPLEKFLDNNFVDVKNYNLSIKERNFFSLKLHAYRLVFINGKFSSLLSDKHTGFWKIHIRNQKNNLLTKKPIITDTFLYLIESLGREIVKIYLPKEKIETTPLYLLHINQGSEQKKTLTTINYRHQIELSEKSYGEIIEHFVSKNNLYSHFNSSRTSIIIDNYATLKYVKLGFENKTSYYFGYNDIYIKYNSIFNSNNIMLGSKINRNQTNVKINGKNSNLTMNSLLMTSAKDSIRDYSTYIEHNKSYCKSSQLNKTVIQKNGIGIFNGIIKVKKCAQKTNSKMINKNLLLDKSSKINTKPQLNIYADDIKCTHSSTTGYVDKQQILYLQSRGISYKKAKKMLIFSFFSDFIKQIHCKNLQKIISSNVYKNLKK